MPPPTLRSVQLTSRLFHNPTHLKPRFQCLHVPARQRQLPSQPSFRRAFSQSTSTATRRRWAPVRQGVGSLEQRLWGSFGDGCRAGSARMRGRGYKTVQEQRARYKLGPLSVTGVVLFFGTGIGMIFYFRFEKARVERKRIADQSKGVGKPKVGGAFELVDQDGRAWDSKVEMGGRFTLVYFGFSHCPDICPEELDKMASMLDIVGQNLPPEIPKNPSLLPVFVTCDPARDTPAVLKTYLKEFHPNLVGLTGTWDQIKAVCKLYRVYFSTPPGVKPGMDYLVDHSIYFYLMDPEGDFVEAIGRQHTAEKAAKIITEHMADWKGRVTKP